MAKTATAEAEESTVQKDEARRQRKKQARREAKIMLKIERAKKDVQKAQKKLTQAQSQFDTDQTHLHDLEAKLQQLRTGQDAQAQGVSVGEQDHAQAEQTSSSELPELKPEDFRTQEAVDEAYQEPLLMPASSSPQADTDAIEAFHTASTNPAEGRDDVAFEQGTSQAQEDGQPAQQVIAAPVSTVSEPDEQSVASEAIVETDTTTPEDTATKNYTFVPWQDDNQSLIDHGNEEPELSNNPLASAPENAGDPSEGNVETDNENSENGEENMQA